MTTRSRFTMATCTLLSVAVGSACGLPPYTVNVLRYSYFQSSEFIPGIGKINNPFMQTSAPKVGGNGFLGMSVNNSGVSSLLVNVFAAPGFDRAVLNSPTGLNAFLAAGAETSLMDPGVVTFPSADYVYDNGYWTSINNNGDIALSMGLRSSLSPVGPAPSPFTGVYFNKSAIPVREGDAVTAAGVAPGTTFGNFNAAGMVRINDNNVVMIAGPIVEGGITKNAIIKAALDGSGGLLSQTLVAKEGGPVGAGPATWSLLSVAPLTCAMNNSGAVIFSGITSTGTNGIYLNNAFVATTGGAAPGSQTWASLFGTPLDLSHSGQFVFRGPLASNGIWTETGDAGEGMNNANGGGTPLTAQTTTGGGPFTLLNGSLSTDQDVDLYAITVDGGPTNIPFSATTVPDAGSGFAGANFDTVLYLFKYLPNMNFNTRAGIGRCDDAAPGVIQSTLTSASLSSTHTPGTRYILGVSTPKSRAWANGIFGGGTPTQEMWSTLPSRIAVGSTSGLVFWTDPSKGQIARSSLSSATLLSPLSVTNPPAQSSELQALDPNSTLLGDAIAVHDAGVNSKVFFLQNSFGATAIRKCNTDGTGLVDVIGAVPSGTPNAGSTTAIAVDSVNGALYWCTQLGKINKSDLDGNSISTVYSTPTTESITAMAIDTKTIGGVPGTGRIFWYNATAGAINRARLDGTSVQSVISVPEVSSMTIDPVGRRLYYTSKSDNRIRVIGVDSPTVFPDLATPTTTPVGISFDPGSNNVYWSSPSSRTLQRSPIVSPSIQNWTAIGADVGERTADGPGAFGGYSAFVRNGTPGTTAQPYSIKLTGAKFISSSAMICKNNNANVDGGIAGTSPGGTSSSVRINDAGAVAWSGNNSVYVNQTQVLADSPITIGGVVYGRPFIAAPKDLAASDNLQHILVQVYNGSNDFSGQAVLQIDFDSVPTAGGVTCCRGTTCQTVTAGACTGVVAGSLSTIVGTCGPNNRIATCCYADYDHNGTATIDDIFIYLNAWFTTSPYTKVGGDGIATPTIDDIFIFISTWFGGCTP